MVGFIQIGTTAFNIARIERIDDSLNASGCTVVIDAMPYAVSETRDQVIQKIRKAEQGEVPVLSRRGPQPDQFPTR